MWINMYLFSLISVFQALCCGQNFSEEPRLRYMVMKGCNIEKFEWIGFCSNNFCSLRHFPFIFGNRFVIFFQFWNPEMLNSWLSCLFLKGNWDLCLNFHIQMLDQIIITCSCLSLSCYIASSDHVLAIFSFSILLLLL